MTNKRYHDAFLRRCWDKTDISEHLPILYVLAKECREIVEFGVRKGYSTVAFLAGLEETAKTTCLYSFDCNTTDLGGEECEIPLGSHTVWVFTKADTGNLEDIPQCDMLFIDTLHTYDQVVAELKHHRRVGRWIVFHDTVLFGKNGQRGQKGIRPAINTFLARNPEWGVLYEYRHNSGLMILQRK